MFNINSRNRFLLLVITAVTLAGCSKNLNQTPVSTASRDAIFSSEDGLKLYVNSFYNILPGINDVFRGDEISDYGARSQVADYLRTGAYTSRQGTGWSWTNLRNINYFIANCNNPVVPQAVRENYIGVARFFRALFYFNMVKRFGDVPWISKLTDVTDPSLYASRDPRTLVMDSVLADMNYAIDHITLSSDATRSLITKWVAYGLKSRVCLFEGTFRKYQTSYNLAATANTWLQNAADASKAVMTGGGFVLNQAGGTDASYRQLFISTAPVTNEVMLSNVSSTSLAVYNDATWYFTSSTYGVRFSFTRTFINTFLNIDGTPFTNKAGHDTITFAREVQGRDKRLQQTIRSVGYTRLSSGKLIPAPPVFSYVYTGYQPIKWSLDDDYYDNGVYGINSICIMRYAEMLLNYAEARAELGQLTDDDWSKTIGALRARAGITGGLTTKPVTVDPYMQANYFPGISDAALLEIRRDRGIELNLEGFRFYDLVRWKRGELLLQQWNGFYVPALNQPMDLNNDGIFDVCFYKTLPSPTVPGVTYINVSPTVNGVVNPQRLANDTYGEIHWLDNIGRDWQDYKYLYPIPITDLQLNPKLGQNTGW
jgi:hypothetical protein